MVKNIDPGRKRQRGCTALPAVRRSIRLSRELKTALSCQDFEQRRCQDCCPGSLLEWPGDRLTANDPCPELERLLARLDTVLSEVLERWNA